VEGSEYSIFETADLSEVGGDAQFPQVLRDAGELRGAAEAVREVDEDSGHWLVS
jgi:hypothetical protein